MDKPLWDEIHDNFIEVLSSFDETELDKFFLEFLTHEERTMLAKRLALYLMLLGGYSDTEIKELLKMSHETIRIARDSVQAKSPEFKERFSKWIKKPKSSKESSGLLNMVELALGARSDKRARAKLLSGDY